jgi:hypothetical protein
MCVCVCVCVWVCVYVYICVCVCVYGCVCIYTCVCVCLSVRALLELSEIQYKQMTHRPWRNWRCSSVSMNHVTSQLSQPCFLCVRRTAETRSRREIDNDDGHKMEKYATNEMAYTK